MSLTIRSKGGQPLLVSGMPAAASACCQCGDLCPGQLLVTANYSTGFGYSGDPNAYCQSLRLPYNPIILYGPSLPDENGYFFQGELYIGDYIGNLPIATIRFFIPRNAQAGSKVRLQIIPSEYGNWSATYESDYLGCPNAKCSGQSMYVFKPSDLVSGSSSFCGGNVEFVVTHSDFYDCGDFCSYAISVTQPSNLATTGKYAPCYELRQPSENKTAYSLSASLPSGTSLNNDESYSVGISYGGYELTATVSHAINGETPNTSADCTLDVQYYDENPNVFAFGAISATIVCVPGRTPRPFGVLISVGVSVDMGFSDEKIKQCAGTYRWGKGVIYELPATCMDDTKPKCFEEKVTSRFIDAPVEFSATAFTTSLGDYDSTYENKSEFGLSGIAAEIGEAIRDALSATFRITSRPKCNNVACNCAAPLGGMYVDLGNLISATSSSTSEYQVNSSLVDFVWMYDRSDETVSWQGPFGLYEYDQNDPDGPQDGNGKFTRRLWRQRAELYCDVIDGVAQWFVLFTSFRDIYDEAGFSTHRSYDEWVGKIDCFKACEDLNNYIEADEPVPMGEPYDIEYLGRTTEAGYLECEPPPRLTIRLTQVDNC